MQSLNEASLTAIGTVMGGISTFTSTIDNFKKKIAKYNKKNYSSLNSTSIMNASKDLVMSFPVICSTSLSVETALMIQKAIESNCVSTLRMLFASASLQGDSGVEVIKQWHNNISGDPSIDDYFDYIEAMGNALAESSIDYVGKYSQQMIEECKRNEVYYPISNFSESSLLSYELSYKKDGSTDVKVVNEKKNIYDPYAMPGNKVWIDADKVSIYDDKTGKWSPYPDEEKIKKDITNSLKKSHEWDHDKNQEKYWDAQSQNAADRLAYDKQKDARTAAMDRQRLDIDRQKLGNEWLKGKTEYLSKQLLDSDIKKANELVPSMIVVRYTVVGKSSENINVIDEFIAGVKARLIGCDSLEIIDRIRLVMENKVDMKNFIRATTGEIKFCKDFILAIDQAKIEAKRNSRLSKTSPIWRALQNRSTKSTYKRISKQTNTAAAITSLVISAEECRALKDNFNIDLYNVAKCRQVMEAYNFMEIVIADDSLEIARFLLDNGDKYFQDYSYGALRKEVGDADMKKLINIMATNNRG